MKITAKLTQGTVTLELVYEAEADTTERLPDPAAWAAFCRATQALAAKSAPEPVESKPDPASDPCASPAERVCEALRERWPRSMLEIAARTGLGLFTLDQVLDELQAAGKIQEVHGCYTLRVR